MAFDPLTWFVGASLTETGKRVLAKLEASELNDRLRAAISGWCKTLQADLQPSPTAIFPPVTGSGAIAHTRPALTMIRSRLVASHAPSEEEWLGALAEQWQFRRDELGKQAHAFFRQDPSEAKTQLRELAIRLAHVCRQDDALFRATTLDLLRVIAGTPGKTSTVQADGVGLDDASATTAAERISIFESPGQAGMSAGSGGMLRVIDIAMDDAESPTTLDIKLRNTAAVPCFVKYVELDVLQVGALYTWYRPSLQPVTAEYDLNLDPREPVPYVIQTPVSQVAAPLGTDRFALRVTHAPDFDWFVHNVLIRATVRLVYNEGGMMTEPFAVLFTVRPRWRLRAMRTEPQGVSGQKLAINRRILDDILVAPGKASPAIETSGRGGGGPLARCRRAGLDASRAPRPPDHPHRYASIPRACAAAGLPALTPPCWTPTAPMMGAWTRGEGSGRWGRPLVLVLPYAGTGTGPSSGHQPGCSWPS